MFSRSQHYDNLQQQQQQHQQQANDSQKQPLKDTTNTASNKQKLTNNNEEEQRNNEAESQQNSSRTHEQQDQSQQQQQQQGSRSLQCLETLAQKAGIHDITPEDCKYDAANTLLNLDRIHENSLKQEVIKFEYNLQDNMSDIKNQQVKKNKNHKHFVRLFYNFFYSF